MAEPHLAEEVGAPLLRTAVGDFELKETVRYSNGGSSYFYAMVELPEAGVEAADDADDADDAAASDGFGPKSVQRDGAASPRSTAIIVDDGICNASKDGARFEYYQLTGKQNEYMAKYDRVLRFLRDDLREADEYLQGAAGGESALQRAPQPARRSADRADFADASPLERQFEEGFSRVYGADSVRYLWKEYGITDLRGSTRYLDYLVKTRGGDIAVEENGVGYHHPQIIGEERYRSQLLKQNSCAMDGIKLYRFSTEDCRFAERFEDDIRAYFGESTEGFTEAGLVADRPFALYEHQEVTLEEMAAQRAAGCRSFLVVFPTASGKSRIVEEDMLRFAAERGGLSALVLVPNDAVHRDWDRRFAETLGAYEEGILVCSNQYMGRHFGEFPPDCFDYIVVDEAHHAVAPGLKRTIQHFDPEFLVGLTATDERPDKKRLEAVFGSYRVGLSLQEAMEKGIVARANVFRIETNIDLSQVRINGKDYVNADLEKSIRVTSRNELVADVLREYFSEGEVAGRQGIVFCVNVRHAEEMAKLLNDAGLPASAYSSKSRDPQGIMRAFQEKRIRFLCTCQMISEGWDYPELGILVMARPTLSKVLYLQQLGRGLRKTRTKGNVFVIDVVDEYGSAVAPCSMHTIFKNPCYVPFGDVLRRDYAPGELIEVGGLVERVERITEVDVLSFADRYGDYLSEEQLAREYFVSTGTVSSWVRKGRIVPSASFMFGSKKVNLFSPEDAERYRVQLGIGVHNDETIRDDFFAFLEERDYSLSYKMPFLLSLLDRMNELGEAEIERVLDDYIAFYRARLDAGLPVDRATCPYTADFLADRKAVKRSMLANPFEKFERKRFLYHSKDLGIISMNHALHAKLSLEDYEAIRTQMRDDLEAYYAKLGE